MKLLRLFLALLVLVLGPAAQATTTATVNATLSVFSSITFSPAFLAFGSQQVGTSVTAPLTVSNGGTATLNFSTALTGANSAAFSFSSGCGSSLAAGASCQISVSFNPSVVGSDSAALVLTGAGRSYTAQLSGSGSAAPPPPPGPVSIALSPSSIQIPDNATGGSIVATATVTMSDGSTNFNGALLSSNTNYFTISGLNIVLTHGLTPADDGAQNTVICIQSGNSCQ